MRALVTGAGGFAGAYLLDLLRANNDNVLPTSPEESNQGGFKKLDVTDYENCIELLAQFAPEVIYHLAGVSFAPDAERDFAKAQNVNVQGTLNLFRACEELKLNCTLLLASSAEVYGKISAQDLPLREEQSPLPANNYSRTKLMAEQVALGFKDVRSVIIRAFNHIGAGQRSDFVVPAFASQLAAIIKGKAEPVVRVGNLEARRDFSDVRDIVRGYRMAALKGNGVYNLCSGKAVSIQYILDTLIEFSGIKVRVEQDPARMRPAEVPEIYGSYEKANRELDWRPHFTDLRETLKTVLQYYTGKN